MTANLLREFFEYAPVGITKIDHNCCVLELNRVMQKELQIPEEDIIGRNILEVLPDINKTAITNLVAHAAPFHYKRQTISKIGSIAQSDRYWDVIGWPVTFDNGAIQEIILLAVDVSKEMQVQRQRNEFVESLAYAIRNPLIDEQIVLNSLLEEYASQIRPPTMIDIINSIRKSNETFLVMLSTLLEEYQYQHEAVSLLFQALNPAAVISRCLYELKALIMLSQISIETKLAPDLPWIEGDDAYLQRLFLNLLYNAIKFTPAGGTIELSVFRAEQDFVTFQITDTGWGIAETKLSKLFERATSAELQSHNPEGTGLGLYICRCITEKHKGTISCQSQLNVGTTFTVRLPVRQGR